MPVPTSNSPVATSPQPPVRAAAAPLATRAVVEKWFKGVQDSLPPLAEQHPLRHVELALPELIRALGGKA